MGGNVCTARSRCKNARECDFCARKRQAQIAGMAEKLEQDYGQLTYTVLRPKENTAAALKAVHASFMRRALAPAGIWTVETGELFGGLHLNILSPAPKVARWRCMSYSELVESTAREAGAYIAKREGLPDALRYAGRLYGSWGRVGELLARQEAVPIVQAAALEVAMGGGAMGEPAEIVEPNDWEQRKDKCGRPLWVNKSDGQVLRVPPPARMELTRDEYREIAMRNLAKLRGACPI